MLKKKPVITSLDHIGTLITALDKKIEATSMALNERMDRIEMTQHRLRVLLEHLETNFKLMLEGFKSHDLRMDRIEAHVDEGFAEMSHKFEILFERVDKVGAAFVLKAPSI